MATFKEKCVDWAIDASKHGSAWWMPLCLILVSCINSLTGGVFVWCIGVMQAVLFTLVGMSNGKLGVVLAPICITIGASVAAYTYIQLMKSGGAATLLETTGAKDSKFLEMAQEWARDYGVWGLIFIQVNPLTPVPTAVLVVAGMLARMNEYTMMSVLMLGKFLMLLLNSTVVYFASQGKTVEECLREQLKNPLSADANGKDAAKGDTSDKKDD
eukprot:gnl/MRDRNA2_/MRDRNA2_95347_c0_seq1.p1 gnl/MRDRNA2_/MRDRNA2_95347_c0~~gnl/MRDRNA2_/MRDRNA2_95347_c0_seq1.p1  ORF type:complete len:214 (+),score=40.55 gnl/MRDRNA2_/MRDRNA2_95347_c0_seq1:60-701(+)